MALFHFVTKTISYLIKCFTIESESVHINHTVLMDLFYFIQQLIRFSSPSQFSPPNCMSVADLTSLPSPPESLIIFKNALLYLIIWTCLPISTLSSLIFHLQDEIQFSLPRIQPFKTTYFIFYILTSIFILQGSVWKILDFLFLGSVAV